MRVRLATAADADAGSHVLRRSISELCRADHGGDPASIAAWTANKTPADWSIWLAQPEASLLVAECGERIVGVGMVDGGGVVLLNYVAPEARGRGVSTALLDAMEEACLRRGVATCRLESTKTAERFYLARGYAPTSEAGAAGLAKHLA